MKKLFLSLMLLVGAVACAEVLNVNITKYSDKGKIIENNFYNVPLNEVSKCSKEYSAIPINLNYTKPHDFVSKSVSYIENNVIKTDKIYSSIDVGLTLSLSLCYQTKVDNKTSTISNTLFVNNFKYKDIKIAFTKYKNYVELPIIDIKTYVNSGFPITKSIYRLNEIYTADGEHTVINLNYYE